MGREKIRGMKRGGIVKAQGGLTAEPVGYPSELPDDPYDPAFGLSGTNPELTVNAGTIPGTVSPSSQPPAGTGGAPQRMPSTVEQDRAAQMAQTLQKTNIPHPSALRTLGGVAAEFFIGRRSPEAGRALSDAITQSDPKVRAYQEQQRNLAIQEKRAADERGYGLLGVRYANANINADKQTAAIQKQANTNAGNLADRQRRLFHDQMAQGVEPLMPSPGRMRSVGEVDSGGVHPGGDPVLPQGTLVPQTMDIAQMGGGSPGRMPAPPGSIQTTIQPPGMPEQPAFYPSKDFKEQTHEVTEDEAPWMNLPAGTVIPQSAYIKQAGQRPKEDKTAPVLLKPEEYISLIDQIADPKNKQTADLNRRSKALTLSAVQRGDAKSAQAEIDSLRNAVNSRESGAQKISINLSNAEAPLTKMEETRAKAIANYAQAPIGSYAANRPGSRGGAIMAHVMDLNPDYRETNYHTYQKTENDFTSGTEGRKVNAVNTVIGHLAVLNEAAEALKNNNIRLLNNIANKFNIETGGNAVTTYKTIVRRVAPELSNAYVTGGGTAEERSAAGGDFNENASPQQLQSAIKITGRLLGGKINALADQYKRGTYERGSQRLITPESQTVLDKLAGGAPSTGMPAKAGTVNMRAPNGTVQPVPADQVEHYKQRGATVVP